MSVRRSPNRKHDREVFYKYMSVSTAKAVLRGRRLRWSSPILFNDPFDVPRELAQGISSSEIQKAVGEHFADLLQHPPDHLGELSPKVAFVVNAARGATPELIKQMVEAAVDVANEQAKQTTSANFEAIREMWRDWIPDFRILCLCSSPEKTSMWYHYADQYTGIVLELRCSDERDSPWLAAEPVLYPVDTPPLLTPAGWGRLMSLQPEIAIRRLLHEYTFNKTPDWSYEEEWRITSFKRPDDVGHFTDYRVAPLDFSKVFLGPHISDQDRLEMLRLLIGDLSHVEAFQARIESDRHFSFAPLTL